MGFFKRAKDAIAQAAETVVLGKQAGDQLADEAAAELAKEAKRRKEEK
jgi:hypothetical protein